jgi:DNA-binding MarR family transcriptional regulator
MPFNRGVPITENSTAMTEAVQNLRRTILAGEHYRQVVAAAIGLGATESRALSYLAVNGDTGQSDLAHDLDLTSSAATALVDRLERQGVAERARHPRDRRRSIIRLTERGQAMVGESHRWLAATLARVRSSELETVSASLAIIANDLSSRTSAVGDEGWPDRTRALPT